MLYNAALVLEGGAFRGQYTAGVVDTFLAHHIEFDSVIGVSAGSLCGANFVSKQYGRAAMININHRHDRDYISFSHLLHRQTIINLDYLFEDHGWRWENFNERAYERSASNFTAVATSMVTGKAVSFTNPVGDELTRALKASSSMPIIAKPQRTSKGLCLDGGVADSIPYDLAQQQGYDKIVVIRTRDITYRKEPTSRTLASLYERYYGRDYPLFVRAAINRPTVYNHQVEEINRLTKEKKLFTIAPQQPVKVSRIEGNVKKLRQLYETGQREARSILPQMIKYLEH
ncbi:patatin-like phospholipase family protein [Limosilactobacillus kribbianus]|uniref:patatin-like phospholipase family protein n=1 Tax=Limosilactobacillus kribbianus TaxID=2982695 RepID=UPI0022651E40|nr:patatin family protein [Limosilactobacillus kribbianus]